MFFTKGWLHCYRHAIEYVPRLFLSWFGPLLCRRYGNDAVARAIVRFARLVNCRGAAVLWPDAPWFNTYDSSEEDDCVNHTFNYDPVAWYRGQGIAPWWERLGKLGSPQID